MSLANALSECHGLFHIAHSVFCSLAECYLYLTLGLVCYLFVKLHSLLRSKAAHQHRGNSASIAFTLLRQLLLYWNIISRRYNDGAAHAS